METAYRFSEIERKHLDALVRACAKRGKAKAVLVLEELRTETWVGLDLTLRALAELDVLDGEELDQGSQDNSGRLTWLTSTLDQAVRTCWDGLDNLAPKVAAVELDGAPASAMIAVQRLLNFSYPETPDAWRNALEHVVEGGITNEDAQVVNTAQYALGQLLMRDMTAERRALIHQAMVGLRAAWYALD